MASEAELLEGILALSHLYCAAELTFVFWLPVADKIITEFRGLATYNYEFHLNHELLVQVLLQHVPERSRAAVESILADFGTSFTPAQTRQAIAKEVRLPKQVLDELEQCMMSGKADVYTRTRCLFFDDPTMMGYTGTLPEVRQRFETHFPKSLSRIRAATSDLEQTIRFAGALGVRRQMLIRPTLTKNIQVSEIPMMEITRAT
jgi:hypothetical protein